MLDTRPAGMLPKLHAFAEADLRPVLPRIAVPTLLLYGDADVRSSLAVAEELRAAIQPRNGSCCRGQESARARRGREGAWSVSGCDTHDGMADP